MRAGRRLPDARPWADRGTVVVLLGSMGSHNALYLHGGLPADYRPTVEGPCAVRQLGPWTQLSLPGVEDGTASALELSERVQGKVIWTVVQTTASAVSVVHFEQGRQLRRVEFADGSWYCVEGEPQGWEERLFSDAELEAAMVDAEAEDFPEIRAVFRNRILRNGQRLPWPDEWRTVRSALDVTEAEFDAALRAAPLRTVQGKQTSKLTHVTRSALLAGIASVAALSFTRDGGFAALGVVCLLVAALAGWLRQITYGRWIF